MTYKTILLHLANDAGHQARIRVAAELARRFEAHVVALYVATPVSMPAAIEGRGASYAFMAEATAIAHEKAEGVERECGEKYTADKLSWEWKIAEGDHLNVLAKEAPYADLAIVSHSKTEVLEDRIALQVPENLPLVVGCPVIVLPEAGFNGAIGRRILIAWRPCVPAYRAVELAMPFLREADEVTVCSIINEDATQDDCQRLVGHLGRHGIEARALVIPEGGASVGETLLAEAKRSGADTLVMGTYGHSRVREMVLGGVTRHALDHVAIPMLVSH